MVKIQIHFISQNPKSITCQNSNIMNICCITCIYCYNLPITHKTTIYSVHTLIPSEPARDSDPRTTASEPMPDSKSAILWTTISCFRSSSVWVFCHCSTLLWPSWPHCCRGGMMRGKMRILPGEPLHLKREGRSGIWQIPFIRLLRIISKCNRFIKLEK